MSSTASTKVAVVQHNAGTDVEANLQHPNHIESSGSRRGRATDRLGRGLRLPWRHEGKQEILEPLPAGGLFCAAVRL